MTIDYTALKDQPRLLLEATLKPVQGERFQATGFADLGAALYKLHDGTQKLLVESAQSVANRLEMTIWDEANDELIPELKGLAYIQVTKDGNNYTNSILEAHRINSDYILTGKDQSVTSLLKSKFDKAGPLNNRDLANFIFTIDPNSLLHGVFLEKIAGRLRLPRLISGFIEATNVHVAESGGVKHNRVDPTLKEGKGNIPYPRTEFTAEEVKAFFNIDLALLRGYGLGDDATNLLLTLALYKIQRFLSTGLRLRTACDLEAANGLAVTRPSDFIVPNESELLTESARLIAACKSMFSENPITQVNWVESKKKQVKADEAATDDES